MATLRELSNDYKYLSVMLENLELIDGDDDEEYNEQVKAVLDTMESIDSVIEEKVDNYCVIIKEKQSNIEKIDNEIERLKQRKKTLQNSIEWLKANLAFSMEQRDLKQVKTVFNTCSLAKAGIRALTLKVDPKDLPDEFRKVEYKADNKALRDYFKEHDIEENRLAVLEPATTSLRIR